MSFVSVLLLRCSLHQCGLEAAARCTSWPWTETASWTGEGTAALVSVWNPAGFGEESASETLKKRMHTNVNSSLSLRLALTHALRLKTHTQTLIDTWTHTQTQCLNPFQPTLLKIQFVPSPLITLSLESSWKITDELQMLIPSLNLYCTYSCLDLLYLVNLCSVVTI